MNTLQNKLFGRFGPSARKLGTGRFAPVMELPTNVPAFRDFVAYVKQHMKPLSFQQLTHLPPTVAVKLILPKPGENTRAFTRAALREYIIHKRLATSPCRRLGGKTFCAAEVVPKLYFAAIDPQTGGLLVCMESLRGKTVYNYEKTRNMTFEQYLAVEKAVLTLLVYGIFHGDFHTENIMIDPSGRAKIIDFGASTTAFELYWDVVKHMPPRERPQNRRAFVKEQITQFRRRLARFISTWPAKRILYDLKTSNHILGMNTGLFYNMINTKIPNEKRNVEFSNYTAGLINAKAALRPNNVPKISRH